MQIKIMIFRFDFINFINYGYNKYDVSNYHDLNIIVIYSYIYVVIIAFNFSLVFTCHYF